jgi:hypothetical protein
MILIGNVEIAVGSLAVSCHICHCAALMTVAASTLRALKTPGQHGNAGGNANGDSNQTMPRLGRGSDADMSDGDPLGRWRQFDGVGEKLLSLEEVREAERRQTK